MNIKLVKDKWNHIKDRLGDIRVKRDNKLFELSNSLWYLYDSIEDEGESFIEEMKLKDAIEKIYEVLK